MYTCDNKVNLVEFNVLAGEGLSTLEYFWIETQFDGRGMGVSECFLRVCRYE